MLLNCEGKKVLFIGLAIALASCNNPGDRKPTQIIVSQPTASTDTAVDIVAPSSSPLFDDPPIVPATQNTPRPRPKKTPVVIDSGEIPVIVEGSPIPQTKPLVLPSENEPKFQLTNDSIDAEIKDSLSNEFGIDINSVRCPNTSSIGRGKTVTCQVQTSGGNFSVRLTNIGNRLEYEPQGIILISQLESNIETAASQRQGQKIQASCDGEVLIFSRGDYINCKAIDSVRKTRSARVTFNNLTGNPGGINVAISGVSTSSTSSANSSKKQQVTANNSAGSLQNSQKLEKSLKSLLAKDIGTSIASVSCPDRVEKNFNKVYTCQANTGKRKFSLAVKLTNPQGGFRYQAKGVILPNKLGELISQEVENSTGRKVEVDCGETAIVFQAGESLGCQISTGRGEPQNIKVTIQDAEGKKVKVDYSLAG